MKKKDTASHVPALVFFFFLIWQVRAVWGTTEEKEITVAAERHKHKASILKADSKSPFFKII